MQKVAKEVFCTNGTKKTQTQNKMSFVPLKIETKANTKTSEKRNTQQQQARITSTHIHNFAFNFVVSTERENKSNTYIHINPHFSS